MVQDNEDGHQYFEIIDIKDLIFWHVAGLWFKSIPPTLSFKISLTWGLFPGMKSRGMNGRVRLGRDQSSFAGSQNILGKSTTLSFFTAMPSFSSSFCIFPGG